MLVRACLEPTVPCMLKPMQSTTVLASQDTVTSAGFPADHSGVPADAVTRGKQGKQSNMTSRGAHERFHRPSETLRNLHYCTRDIPVSWTKMLDVEQSCDACLRAKAAHQHHSGTLPETTALGEIYAFDLWKTQTASVLGGERDVFGVIDLFSDFSDVTRIRSKTNVPDCIAQFIAYAASVGASSGACTRITRLSSIRRRRAMPPRRDSARKASSSRQVASTHLGKTRRSSACGAHWLVMAGHPFWRHLSLMTRTTCSR